MKDGRITQAGKYHDILESGTDFMHLIGAHKEALSALSFTEVGAVTIGEGNSFSGNAKNVLLKKESRDAQNGEADNIMGTKGQLVEEEEREKGGVGLSVYRKYIMTAYGGALVPFILLAQILFQLLQIGSNYWMAWATPISKDVPPPVGGYTLIIVYVAFGIGCSFCTLARALLLVTAGCKTAMILFEKMHQCIFRAPMSFFDATPSGRILNRVRKMHYFVIAACNLYFFFPFFPPL